MGRSFPIRPNGERQCAACLGVFPLFDFAASRTGLQGYSPLCTQCHRIRASRYGKKWYSNKLAANPVMLAKHEERRAKREAKRAEQTLRADRRANGEFRRSLARLIQKRCEYGTNVCYLEDRDAHIAASHLLDAYGRVLPGRNAEYKSLFLLNKPARKAKTLAKEQRAADRAVRRNLPRKVLSVRFVDEPSEQAIERALYERIRYHLKKQRRRGRTVITFSKWSFVSLFGWTLRQLRERLSATMPANCSWKDVLNGSLHVDHMMPAAVFDLTTVDGIRSCYSLDNLQLLTAEANAIKSVDDAWYAKVFR